ncbi:hypothetical protein CIB84_007300 [Bambusicola thoracicus]|uniref:Spindle and centriole-associated protein 1 n=1 Tax=Bambusicola thoracicus TaxID=9083 RepID=A0A2P4SXW0_BAMTH|nr:hypothetical protein CIB84_007300 [Bambusicola thoracicus]
MSLLSGPRPRLRGAARKGPRKATAVKRDWDSTVHDLTVHRATPEDIILSDQYDMQDVLKRSDQVMAVVKGLVGNAPRTRSGFPNVTMAPNCDVESSQGPVVQKWEPPTQLSILSESVMDSQGKKTRHYPYANQKMDSINLRISNPVSVVTVKRKQNAQNSAGQSRDDSPAYSIPMDLQRDNKSSLDVLSCMIHEVEHELEEYERCTGREVKKMQKSEGLTGFTLSLVNALCRLMRYLKEVRRL